MDDPLLASLFQTITQGIVLCFSGGDGLRLGPTNAAVPPSGGSAPTNVVGAGARPTDLNDVAESSMPSLVHDSGAISVGGTTLNDVTAAPPFNPRYHALVAQQAFPETRFTGARNYASDYGSRVPGDNVLAIAHALGDGPGDVQVLNIGGTSASAPQVAAAAAVVLQVAKLIGDRRLAASPALVRQLLVRNGTPEAHRTSAGRKVGE